MTAVIIPFPKPKPIPTASEQLDQLCDEHGLPRIEGRARRLILGLFAKQQATECVATMSS